MIDRRDVLLLEAEELEEADRARGVDHRDRHMIRVAEHRRRPLHGRRIGEARVVVRSHRLPAAPGRRPAQSQPGERSLSSLNVP